jgi:hypothetical protein
MTKYEWRENVGQVFMSSSDGNKNSLCVYGVQFSLQRNNIVEVVNALHFKLER